MGIFENAIEAPICLSKSLFVEEEHQYQPNHRNLEEWEDMSHIISIHVFFVNCS